LNRLPLSSFSRIEAVSQLKADERVRKKEREKERGGERERERLILFRMVEK
jgi:hypothetical protein